MNREARVDQFLMTYRPCLLEAVQNHPEEYAYSLREVPHVAERMRTAFLNGTYNHDSRAIRSACRKLGLKPTRKALEAFLAS